MKKVLTIEELRNEPGFVSISREESIKRINEAIGEITHYLDDITLFEGGLDCFCERIYTDFKEITLSCESAMQAVAHYDPEK